MAFKMFDIVLKEDCNFLLKKIFKKIVENTTGDAPFCSVRVYRIYFYKSS